MSEQHAEYIRDLVRQAAIKDPHRNIFGAFQHKYQLNQVVSLKEVRQFEEKHHVKLPEEYVFFLTKVGNGGAGPDYGIYSLDEVKSHNSKSICREGAFAFIDKNLTEDAWDIMMEEMLNDEKYDALMDDMSEGLLIIGTQGCPHDNILMCKGSEQGKIVYFNWDLESEFFPYFTGMGFLEWYESYFREIIADHKVDSYGSYSLKSEEELRNSYKENLSLKEKKKIMEGFYKFKKVEEKTLDFFEQIKDKRLDSTRTKLLFDFDFDRGLTLFEELLAGKNAPAAVECACLIPKEQKNKYYERMIKLLYRKNECGKYKIIFYLMDCSLLKASDIINFAMDESQEEEVRYTALWAMKESSDKFDFIEQLIQIMRGESYKAALGALDVVMLTDIKSQKLLETYIWMQEKYKEDRNMMSALKTAIKIIRTVL
ncbi:MAG: SMI1/KNR4 family protein [Lachnospiraceae bacterium]|nr:SMI1/KNR4 family protein [Lachnospiraceae bacterium]